MTDVIRWRCCLCKKQYTANSAQESEADQERHARTVHPDVWYGPKQGTR